MLHAKLVVGLRAPKLLPKWLGSTGDRAFLPAVPRRSSTFRRCLPVFLGTWLGLRLKLCLGLGMGLGLVLGLGLGLGLEQGLVWGWG